MRFSKIRSSRGSAVLELITFVLVGQLLVSGWLVQIANELDHKMRLQLFAISLARSSSLGTTNLEARLRQDLSLPRAEVRQLACGESLTCLSVTDGSGEVTGVSHS